MALHFLDIGPLPDAVVVGIAHGLEVYEAQGEFFIKASLAAPSGIHQAYCADGTPYTAHISASMRVTPEQLKRIEQAMADARCRIGA